MTSEKLLLGIDGGGTKTVAAIASVNGANNPTILGQGRSGPSNVRAVGIASATTNLEQAINQAFANAGIHRRQFAAACLGLAGSDRKEEKQLFRSWAEKAQIAKNIQIVNDAIPVLYAGCPDGVGIALICGTGSFAYGRDSSGATARNGGWGYLAGDEGSGYWIAVEGLRKAVRFADGRSQETVLLERFIEHFDIASPQELIPRLYSDSTHRRDIADLSNVIFEAAEQRDEVSLEIINRAASELVQLIENIGVRLSFATPVIVSMTGGVVLNQLILQSLIKSKLAESTPGRFEFELISDPVQGAIQIAHSSNRSEA